MTLTSIPSAAGAVAQSAPIQSGPGRPPPTLEDLGDALTRFLASGEEAERGQIRELTAALAEQGLGPAACAGVVWEKVRRALLSSTDEERPWLLDRALAAQHELWCLFDRAYELERRAHRQMSAAYARRSLEIDQILDHLPAYAFAKDAQSRYTAANRAFCEALGLPRARIISQTDEALFPPEIAAPLLARDHEVLEGKGPLRQESTTELNGRQAKWLITKAPLVDAEGVPTGLIGVALDSTEQNQLIQSELQLATAVRSAHDSMLVMDPSGTILYVNPAFERLTKYTAAEVVGHSYRTLHKDRKDNHRHDRMWNRLAAGKAWRGVAPMRRRDGTEFESDRNISPVYDDGGMITGFVSVARDVTEQKQVMEALRDAIAIKSDFTSMISHELRTPLCAIKEAVDVVADGSAGPTNDHQAQFLGLAKRNVDRLHRLINDVLDFSRMERDEAEPAFGLHALNELVAETCLKRNATALRRGIDLGVELDPAVELVPIDPDRISQVLGNVLANAVRFGDGAWIRVSTRKSADEVIVTIRDSGPGIEPQYLETIFDPFVQLSSGLGRQVGGTGLGLAICRQIIELHGGRIWAESTPGEGSAFSFALPLAPKEENTSP